MVGRLLRFAVIHRERAQDGAVGGYHGRGPAGPEAVAKGKVAVISPQRIARDIRHDHLASHEGRSPAGAGGRANSHAIDRMVIRLREAGRGAMAQVQSVRIEEQNGIVRPI